MTKKKYRRYSAEFKQQALRRASEDGVTDKEVCEDLGVSERQLRRIVYARERADQPVQAPHGLHPHHS